MIMLLSDNGASREGGPQGVMDEWSFFNAEWENVDDIVANRLDDIGTKMRTPTTRGAGRKWATRQAVGTSRKHTAAAFAIHWLFSGQKVFSSLAEFGHSFATSPIWRQRCMTRSALRRL